jgi:choice-of-anchor B domain-containing protein
MKIEHSFRHAGLAAICLVIALGNQARGQFTMSNIQLLKWMPLSSIGGGGSINGNDIWGWTDPETGREYAIVGLENGTSFVDVTDPTDPVYLGKLPTHTGTAIWRDMKVYQNHAFIVSDGNGPHGMQVFDLTQLRNVTEPQTFAETAHFGGFRESHNIAINEDTGYAYAVGTNQANGGLYIVDIRNPLSPTFAGQFASDGYTHDTQVVVYHGPDPDYQGHEVAFSSNTDTLTIADVTNKASTFQISRTGYPQAGYTHQGWLSEDHKYFFMDDELDEWNFGGKTRTHLWDVSDLNSPDYLGYHLGTESTIDHNLYVRGNYVYESNYASGLRVLKWSDDSETLTLTEVAYIDTYPEGNPIDFVGTWSNYPYFESGTIVVNDINRGLFVVRLDIAQPDFNEDGMLNCDDINSLVEHIVAGTYDPGFDLTGDGNVDVADRDAWLAAAGAANLPSGNPYLLGDANLDGTVDGVDFVTWNDNKFEAHAAWCLGDFTADGFVDGQDFTAWNENKFQTAEGSAVPEPAMGLTMLWSLVATMLLNRSWRTRSFPRRWRAFLYL